MAYRKDERMNIRIIGAIFIVLSCGSCGFMIAANYHKEERLLRQLQGALDFMQCELQYRLTPLPDLCRSAAANSSGLMRNIFLSLSRALEDQLTPNVEICMRNVLSAINDIPIKSRQTLDLLGKSLGRFDVEGQIRGLESVRQECRRHIAALQENKAIRNRSYQTLGVCAGAALAILFI